MNCNEKFRGLPSKHAEMDAIDKIKNKKDLPKKVDMLVIRLTKQNKLSESRPCYHCLLCMEKSKLNIRFVYYSTKEGTIKKEIFKKMKDSEPPHISSGIKNKLRGTYKD